MAFLHVVVSEKVKGKVCRPVNLKQKQEGWIEAVWSFSLPVLSFRYLHVFMNNFISAMKMVDEGQVHVAMHRLAVHIPVQVRRLLNH